MSENLFSFFEEPALAAAPTAAPPVLTVSDLNRKIRAQLEGQFELVWLRAEISNFKNHTSGHIYFCLKDDGAQIKAVMFRGFNSRLKFKPHDGLEVLVRGRITVYEPRGDYQINCELMEPVGAGALQKAFEQLKAKLAAEGLFEKSRKRKLPEFPRHVAIVTSPTGAAVRDMMNVLSRRFPLAQITLVPTLVQGAQAAPQIVKALAQAYQLPNVDVVIVGRGGGSIEDMWCFNEEAVARQIAASPVPIVSAVGHEIDFTIADFVADLRAPTPSAAAELVVPSTEEILQFVAKERRMLMNCWRNHMLSRRRELSHLQSRLVDPKKNLQNAALRCDELLDRLENAMDRLLEDHQKLLKYAKQRLPHMLKALERKRAKVAATAAVLDSVSPLRVVARGYSITRDESQQLVKSVKQIERQKQIFTAVADGQIISTVTDVVVNLKPD